MKRPVQSTVDDAITLIDIVASGDRSFFATVNELHYSKRVVRLAYLAVAHVNNALGESVHYLSRVNKAEAAAMLRDGWYPGLPIWERREDLTLCRCVVEFQDR